jgi:hypothetical protein
MLAYGMPNPAIAAPNSPGNEPAIPKDGNRRFRMKINIPKSLEFLKHCITLSFGFWDVRVFFRQKN